ncbi:hypothetical protein ACWC0C_07080 [Streptomyces sp. NPDC001709]
MDATAREFERIAADLRTLRTALWEAMADTEAERAETTALAVAAARYAVVAGRTFLAPVAVAPVAPAVHRTPVRERVRRSVRRAGERVGVALRPVGTVRAAVAA